MVTVEKIAPAVVTANKPTNYSGLMGQYNKVTGPSQTLVGYDEWKKNRLEQVPKNNSSSGGDFSNNSDNILVQAAKKAGIVSTVKDKAGKRVVDTSKYIDMSALDDLAKNLTSIDSKFKASKEPVKNFLNKSKALKVASVVANIGVSCLFLGYLVPKAVYKYREMKTGSTKFHVAENIKNDKQTKKDV